MCLQLYTFSAVYQGLQYECALGFLQCYLGRSGAVRHTAEICFLSFCFCWFSTKMRKPVKSKIFLGRVFFKCLKHDLWTLMKWPQLYKRRKIHLMNTTLLLFDMVSLGTLVIFQFCALFNLHFRPDRICPEAARILCSSSHYLEGTIWPVTLHKHDPTYTERTLRCCDKNLITCEER